MKMLRPTPKRVSAMKKRILAVLRQNPRKHNWSHDLYWRFRTKKNIYVVNQALESVGRSRLVNITYHRCGRQIFYGIRAFSMKK